MEAALLYLLKANAVLVLFAAAYYGLLRQLTFFALNRAYLLLALGFAAIYPALPVPALLPAEVVQLLPAAAPTAPAGEAALAVGAPAASAFDWLRLLLGAYTTGTALLLVRLLARLLSLWLVRRRARPALVLAVPVRVLAGNGGPFSFGQTIYLSEDTLTHPADLAAALPHEQAHVRQHHTLDVLVMQLATALAWPNPASWLLRRAALDNLEYLADRAALQTGLDRRAYQYSLLHQQPGGVPAPALAFHFSFLSLKNRIAMLNQPVSTTRQLGRYLLAAPLAMLLALGYSAARAQAAPPATSQHLPAAVEVNQRATRLAPAPTSQAEVPAVLRGLAAGSELGTDALYYLDGQSVTAQKVTELSADRIASVKITTGSERPDGLTIPNGKPARKIVVVTTKALTTDAPASPVQKEDFDTNYTSRPVETYVLVPATLAAITKRYPNARLGEVHELTHKTTRAVQYQVMLIRGKRPLYVYFTPEGEFLREHL